MTQATLRDPLQWKVFLTAMVKEPGMVSKPTAAEKEAEMWKESEMEEVTSFHEMVNWASRIGDVRGLPIEELAKTFSFLKFPLMVISYSFSGLLDDSTLGSDDILTTNNV